MSRFLGYATAWKGSDGRINLKDGPVTMDQANALIYADKLRRSTLDYFVLEIHEPETAAVIEFPETAEVANVQ